MAAASPAAVALAVLIALPLMAVSAAVALRGVLYTPPRTMAELEALPALIVETAATLTTAKSMALRKANLRKVLLEPAARAGTWISVTISPAFSDVDALAVRGDFGGEEVSRVDGARRGDDFGVERNQGDADIGRTDGNAAVHGAEDGMVLAVIAGKRKAGLPLDLAQAREIVVLVPVVGAADGLADVAADGAHVAQFRGSYSLGSLG